MILKLDREGDPVELKNIGLMVPIKQFYEEIVFDAP
jgi:hypothetical protein